MTRGYPVPPVRGLYAIADGETWPPDHLPALVAEWATKGICNIQLRMKHTPEAEMARVARQCVAALAACGGATALWINDSVEVAQRLGLDLHIGQADASSAAARSALGGGSRIGLSTHNLEQAQWAQDDPDVDVVAIGPVFGTVSKVDPEPVVGLEAVEAVSRLVTKPLIGIGGVNLDNAASVFAAGADAIAVIGALRTGPVEPLLQVASRQTS